MKRTRVLVVALHTPSGVVGGWDVELQNEKTYRTISIACSATKQAAIDFAEKIASFMGVSMWVEGEQWLVVK